MLKYQGPVDVCSPMYNLVIECALFGFQFWNKDPVHWKICDNMGFKPKNNPWGFDTGRSIIDYIHI